MIKAKLSNGLNLIYEQNSAIDVVSIQYWVYCGSAYEEAKEYGLSHFIEHLMFKGSKNYTEKEIAGTLEFLGGELNAFTSKEQTCYYVTLPKENYKKGLKVLSNMVFSPRFNIDAINSERGVVIEEINRSDDNPHSTMSKLFNANIFANHSYAHPILGYREIIENVTRKEIVSYHQKHYDPKNMLLTITGNLDFEEFKTELEIILNETVQIQNISKSDDGIKEFIPSTEPKINHQEMPINNLLISFGFNIPNVYHEDVPALDLLAAMLGEGDSSRLIKELRLIEPILSGVSCSSYTPKHAGVFMFSLALEANEETKNRLIKAYNKMKGILLGFKDSITDVELTKAKTIFVSEKAYEMETANGYGRKLGLMFHLKDDLSYEDTYFKNLANVSKSDIIAVLEKYILSNKIYSFSAIIPKNSLKIEDVENLFKKEFLDYSKVLKQEINKDETEIAVPIFENPKEINSTDPKKIEYKGARLILRKINSTPLVAVRCMFKGGGRVENDATQGLGYLMARTFFTGNKKYSTEEIANLTDKTGTVISATSAKNSFIVSSVFLKNYQDEILDLLQESIANPSFEEPFFSSEKHVIKEGIKSREDNLSSFTRLLLQKLLYKSHPYKYDVLGTLETVNSFTKEKVNEHKKQIFTKDKLILSVVGDYEKEKIETWFKSVVDSLDEFTEAKIIPQEAEQTEARYKTHVKESMQTNIMIAYKTVEVNSKYTPVLDVLSAILSGQSGRLFMNLREKYSLAYVVSPLSLSGFDPGYFGIYTACDDSKTALAVEKIREEFDKLREKEVTDLELERAKNYIMGHRAIEMQRYQDQAMRYSLDELFDLGYDSNEKQIAQIMAVSKKDIMDLAKKYFIASRENLVIVSKTDYKDTFKRV